MAPQKVTYKYSIGYLMIGRGNCTLRRISDIWAVLARDEAAARRAANPIFTFFRQINLSVR
jgi:hypothetical protein